MLVAQQISTFSHACSLFGKKVRKSMGFGASGVEMSQQVENSLWELNC